MIKARPFYNVLFLLLYSQSSTDSSVESELQSALVERRRLVIRRDQTSEAGVLNSLQMCIKEIGGA
jgi:hypothetical protein